jgi:hypothetical protein
MVVSAAYAGFVTDMAGTGTTAARLRPVKLSALRRGERPLCEGPSGRPLEQSGFRSSRQARHRRAMFTDFFA